ncbi:MAG: hypothetical protein AB8B63_20640 [Granulosicoccus sp.]
MKYHRPCHIGKLVAGACLIWGMSTAALAGSFTPDQGSTIDTNPVKIAWTSDAPQQWVRAYANGVKIYDSYRQTSASGSVQFSVNPAISTLTVYFYERPASGQWTTTERQYGVSIANDRVNSLADLPCEPDQVAVADGAGNWNCAAQGLPDVEAITAAVDSRFCMEGEELTRAPDGQIACQYSCPYADQLREVGASRGAQYSTFFLDDAYECVVISGPSSPTQRAFQSQIMNEADGVVSLKIVNQTSGAVALNVAIDSPQDQLYCARFMGCNSFDPSAGPFVATDPQ